MDNFSELTIDEIVSVNAGHGSWDTLGEIISGAGAGAIGGAWAGPPGALVGSIVGAGIYWAME
ncbi:Blp family class II bacteriocin [Clostridium perfringens]|uniref:Blp family class II bacteriocin n=1 Tax=Clostridium perfringens TaxID=1502 RepID=UPI001D9759EB|nr:Blp family class II bacteriocin [Clostridium perfringens]